MTIKPKQLPFDQARSVMRQQLVAHLVAAGARPVLEAIIAIEKGEPVDAVLAAFAKVPVSTYRSIGADVLPIHAEFEAAWRAFWRR